MTRPLWMAAIKPPWYCCLYGGCARVCACVAKTIHTDIHQPMVDQMVHCNKTRCTHGASGVGERDKNRVRATATVPACLCRRNNAADPISRECFLSFTIPIPRNERSCRPSLTRSLSLSHSPTAAVKQRNPRLLKQQRPKTQW